MCKQRYPIYYIVRINYNRIVRIVYKFSLEFKVLPIRLFFFSLKPCQIHSTLYCGYRFNILSNRNNHRFFLSFKDSGRDKSYGSFDAWHPVSSWMFNTSFIKTFINKMGFIGSLGGSARFQHSIFRTCLVKFTLDVGLSKFPQHVFHLIKAR